jgi:hypothetical protein
MLLWCVGLYGSFRCRLGPTFFDLFPCCDLLREVCSVVLFNVRPCLYPSLRGRPRSVKRIRARARERPTPIKSVRSSCGTPRRSIIRNTPGRYGQVQGTPRAGVEPQGFARRSGESTPSQESICFHPSCSLALYTSGASRGGQGNGGNRGRAPRQGSKRNEGGPLGSPLFFAPCRHSSLSFMR